MLLVDNKFKILKLKGERNAPSQSKGEILDLQAEIDNPKKGKTRKDHNGNESKTNKTQSKDFR